MKKLALIFSILLASGILAQAQLDLGSFPEYPFSSKLKSATELPSRVDNSTNKYFPEIINQHGWSCNQASSIGYTMTYEMNRVRDLDSKVWENHYTPLFPWNFLNRCNPSIGVSYFDTWEVVKDAGCATFAEFPNYNNTRLWMHGYDRYYAAMKNRVLHNYSIHVDTEEGLNKLKNFLHDHLDGSETGGIANVQIASSGISMHRTNQDMHDPDAPIITSFGENVGHALTVVGYDDHIGYDYNGDGVITNDVDINGDGKVTLADWEMGALILANTWGKNWARGGITYVMYRLCTRDGHQGGFWNKSVHVIKTVKEYEPTLTMKVELDHSRRDLVRLLAGYATDLEATEPEHVMGFAHFNYQGDQGPFFNLEEEDTTRFELGLDISRLTSDLDPNQAVKFFLIVDEKDPTNLGDGKIRSFSVFNYGTEVKEYVSDQTDIPIGNDQITYLTVNTAGVEFDKVAIVPEMATSVAVGETYTRQLAVDGGEGPYMWELVHDYEEVHFERSFPEMTGDTLVTVEEQRQFTWIDLPFNFPFYGEEYLAVVVDKHGALHFNTEFYNYPYAIDTDMRFKVRRSLVPFGRDLIYTHDGDMICYQATDSVLTIIYDATVGHEGHQYDIQFATYLYPDGTIEYHFGQFDQPKGGMYPWVTGISNGDSKNYKLASVSDLGILFRNYGVGFKPLEYPGSVSLSDDGLLSCTPSDPDRIWNIYVQVSDRNNQNDVKAVPISTVNWEETELLSKAYPNPFHRVTTISFKVPQEQQVRLAIYDGAGRLVKSLINESLLTGEYNFYWNGTDYQNRDVNPGLYFYRLEMGTNFTTQKIMKLL